MTDIGGPPANAAEDNAGGLDADDAAESRSVPEITGGADQAQRAPSILGPDDDARRAELLTAALKYAALGMKVIPVRWLDKDRICSCHRGAECPSPGKHPMHDDWPGVSSDDPAVVGHWWRAEPQIPATQWYPFSNVGVVTGRRSGIFVLDEDTYAGGSQTLGAYERRHGPMPVTRVHQTGRGGTHYVFEHPGFEVRNSAKRVLGTGLDVRGENGFVLVPPSVNEGGPYDLNPAHDITPAPAPDWLLALLRNHDKEQAGETLSAEPPVAPNGQTRAYAERALESECLTMRSAESGSRNETLNNCAFSLGQLGGAGILSEDAAFAGLRDAAMAAGLTEGEIRGTFISGWRAGMNRPRNVQWGIMQASWPCRPRTEFGLADRMADHWGDRMRWCPELGTWMTYLGGVWMPATKQEGLWAAQIMIRNLLDTEGRSYETEPEVALDGEMMPSPYDRFTDWVAKQHTRKAVSVAADLATGLPLMRMSQSTFDGNPLVINARNGVVDLCTGELSPHDPEQRMTLQAAASYYPGEPATRWQEFLKQVQPDPAMRAYLQRVAGYCATGQTSEQAAFLLHGTGANGKSVFISVLAHVLGTYAQTMPVETLMASSVDGRIPNDVARMAGKRFLQASETKAGKSLDEQRLKQLTGGDTISARFMRGEYFDFRPVGKILLTTNHLPRMSDDSATWRRIQLITWPVIIPEDQRDGYLQDTLIRDEADGILAWIVEGALAWQRDGLNPPQPVLDALRRYQEEEDTVGQFIDDCLVIKDDDPQRGAIGRAAHEIYAVYVAWCKQNGHTPTAQRGLSTRLKKKGHEPYRGGGWNGFPTLAVRTTFGEVNTEAPG